MLRLRKSVTRKAGVGREPDPGNLEKYNCAFKPTPNFKDIAGIIHFRFVEGEGADGKDVRACVDVSRDPGQRRKKEPKAARVEKWADGKRGMISLGLD